MYKSIIKKILLIILYQLFRFRNNDKIKILAYHRVDDTQDLHDPLIISTDSFDKQIKYLKDNYTVLSANEIIDILNNSKTLPHNSCVITFDDGWMDNYINAYPILKKYNVPAILFISTDFIGSQDIFWHEKLQNLLRNIPEDIDLRSLESQLTGWPNHVVRDILKIINSSLKERYTQINSLISDLKRFDVTKLNALNNILQGFLADNTKDDVMMLTWGQVKEMSEHNIHIGSHTKTHAILTQVHGEQISWELKESKKEIEQNITKTVYFFSYPNGNYNKDLTKYVENSGYIAAFAMVDGIPFNKNDRYEIQRFMVREDTFSGLRGGFSELLFKVEMSGVRRYLKNIFNK